MTAQDVFSKGQQFQVSKADTGIDTVLWAGSLLLLLAIIIAGAGFIHSHTKRKLIHNLYIVASVLALFGYVVFDLVSDRNEKDQYAAELTEWKETVAYPYIKSQPYTDRELVSIDREPVQYVSGIKYHHVVKYRGDNFITNTLLLPGGAIETPEILHDLPAGETPFVRFYELDEDLGHGIDAGTYGLTVHLNQKTEN